MHYTTAREFEREENHRREVKGKAHSAGLETYRIPQGKKLKIYLKCRLGYAEFDKDSLFMRYKWHKSKKNATIFRYMDEAIYELQGRVRSKNNPKKFLKDIKMRLEISLEDKNDA